jgi:hypothetical protein
MKIRILAVFGVSFYCSAFDNGRFTSAAKKAKEVRNGTSAAGMV